MKKVFFFILAGGMLHSAPGIDPQHPELNSAKSSELYAKCKDVKLAGVSHCEQAMLYEMHLNDNIHKGVSFEQFAPLASSSPLATAESESALFNSISYDTDSSLASSIQSNASSFSMGKEMSLKFNKMTQSIESYGNIMDVVAKQTLLEHRIETVITQLLFELTMAKELKDFEASK